MAASKMAIEKAAKEIEMLKIIEALDSAGVPVERVNDFGTLAYMIPNGDLEGRFITIKVVLTKEFNEDTLKGFDIVNAIAQYDEKVISAQEAKAKALAKAESKAAKARKPKGKINSDETVTDGDAVQKDENDNPL